MTQPLDPYTLRVVAASMHAEAQRIRKGALAAMTRANKHRHVGAANALDAVAAQLGQRAMEAEVNAAKGATP